MPPRLRRPADARRPAAGAPVAVDLPSTEHLLSIVAHAAAEPDPRRRALAALSGIGDALGARVVLVVRVHLDPATGAMMYDESISAGDWTPDQQRVYFEYLASPHGRDPFFEGMRIKMIGAGPDQAAIAHARSELVADADWYGSAFFTSVRRPLDLDSSIYGAVRDDAPGKPRGWWLGGGLHRALRAPQFTPAEASLFRTFLLGIRPLFEAFDRQTKAPSARFLTPLSPRHRELVLELLSGRSAKQIGARLSLSPATVQTYCKRLYRQMGVSGRPELIALASDHGVRDAVVVRTPRHAPVRKAPARATA